MDTLMLLKGAATASSSIQKAREYIRGGSMTTVLEQIGDVHLASAGDHLRQAANSPRWEDRLSQALAELQTAYVFYSHSAGRGFENLRYLTDIENLWRARSLAAGCASSIAFGQWILGESDVNTREWLDRAARQLSEFFVRLFYAAEKYRHIAPWQMTARGVQQTGSFEAFRDLERNILPRSQARAIRVKPKDAPPDPYSNPATFPITQELRRWCAAWTTVNDNFRQSMYFYRLESLREWHDPLG